MKTCPDCGKQLIDYGGKWWHLNEFEPHKPALRSTCKEPDHG